MPMASVFMSKTNRLRKLCPAELCYLNRKHVLHERQMFKSGTGHSILFGYARLRK